MWVGDTIYFASDREQTLNLYALRHEDEADAEGDEPRRLRRPLAEPGDGRDRLRVRRLHLPLDLANGKRRRGCRSASAATSTATVPYFKNVTDNIESFEHLAERRARVLVARGDVFTVPAKDGEIRNLTRVPGVRERDPSWSPDGKWIAYL